LLAYFARPSSLFCSCAGTRSCLSILCTALTPGSPDDADFTVVFWCGILSRIKDHNPRVFTSQVPKSLLKAEMRVSQPFPSPPLSYPTRLSVRGDGVVLFSFSSTFFPILGRCGAHIPRLSFNACLHWSFRPAARPKESVRPR